MTRIIPYADKHQPVFKALNLDWLDRFHLTEPRDLEVLDRPRETILDNGGVIFLAETNGEIIGSAALMREHDGTYELAKMAVAAEFRGQGISKRLLEACLDYARRTGAKKVVLFSNHQLKAALSLYEGSGFSYVELKDSPFKTADIKMEMNLQP